MKYIIKRPHPINDKRFTSYDLNAAAIVNRKSKIVHGISFLFLGSFWLALYSSLCMAQTPPQQESQRAIPERVEAFKVGFLTQRLNLTPTEAKAFWPVYNEYEAELEKLRKTRRENLLNAKD